MYPYYQKNILKGETENVIYSLLQNSAKMVSPVYGNPYIETSLASLDWEADLTHAQ